MATSVVIGHASIAENGSINGLPGDSTGKEVFKRPWYSHPWHTVLRPKSEVLASNSAIAMEQACDNDNIGYGQYGIGKNRGSLWQELQKVNYVMSSVTVRCNCDCSSLVNCCVAIGSRNAPGTSFINYSGFATSNMVSVLQNTNQYEVMKDTKLLRSDKYLRRGDILVGTGHTAMVLLNGELSGDNNFAMSGSSATMGGALQHIGSLYNEQVTRGDATLREIGFLRVSLTCTQK